MFAICSRMKWNHLPVEGGIYDQDPELLRRWRIIWAAQDDKDRSDERKRKQEQDAARRKSGGSRGASRSRR